MAARKYAKDDLTLPGTLDEPDYGGDERKNQEIVSQIRKDFKPRDEQYKEYEAAVFYENDVYVPPDYQLTTVVSRSPLPSHIVNTVVSALTTNRPKVQFRPTKSGDPGQLNAERRRHFFEASMLGQEEESENRWFRMFMSALVMKGEGVIKTIERKKLAWNDQNEYTRTLTKRLDDPDDEEYGDIAKNGDDDSRRRVLTAKTEEYKRGRPYPIITTDIPPETFYYWKTLEGFSFIAECKDVPYADTLARFGAGLDSGGNVVRKEALGMPQSEKDQGARMEGVPTLTMYETWTWDRCTYWLAGPGQVSSSGSEQPRGTFIKSYRHRYGDRLRKALNGPYAHALGITTHSRLPHRAGLGILYGFLDLFKLLDSLLTVQSNAAYMTGFPAFADDGTSGLRLPSPFVGDFGDDNAGGAVTQGVGTLRVVPGRVLPKGIKPIDQPRGSVVIDKVLADTRSFLELALPSIVQGMMEGDPSGYAVNQAAYLARLAWTPIVDNAQFALARKVGFESWLIENSIKENVYVWGEQPTNANQRRRAAEEGWLSLGPKDLGGIHRYKVRLDPDTPANEVVKTRTLEAQVNNRMITLDDARLALGGDPEAIERWWQLHDFKQDPEITDKINQQVKDRMRLREQKRAMGGEGQTDLTIPPESATTAAMGTVGEVFQPGQNGTPLMPPPRTDRPGVPMRGGGGMGGVPAGAPPGLPSRAMPLPGQGGNTPY